MQRGLDGGITPAELFHAATIANAEFFGLQEEIGAVWEKLHATLLSRLRGADRLDWSRACVDSASMRAVAGCRCGGVESMICPRAEGTKTNRRPAPRLSDRVY